MTRKQSILAPGWWDFTTLDDEILNDAAKLLNELILVLRNLLPALLICIQLMKKNVKLYLHNVKKL